jgi:hypothetical protein
MATNQENIVAGIETELGLSGLNYNEAIMKLAESYGISQTNFNNMFAQLLATLTSSGETNISGLLAAYADQQFDGNVNSINSYTEGALVWENTNSLWENISINWEDI